MRQNPIVMPLQFKVWSLFQFSDTYRRYLRPFSRWAEENATTRDKVPRASPTFNIWPSEENKSNRGRCLPKDMQLWELALCDVTRGAKAPPRNLFFLNMILKKNSSEHTRHYKTWCGSLYQLVEMPVSNNRNVTSTGQSLFHCRSWFHPHDVQEWKVQLLPSFLLSLSHFPSRKKCQSKLEKEETVDVTELLYVWGWHVGKYWKIRRKYLLSYTGWVYMEPNIP